MFGKTKHRKTYPNTECDIIKNYVSVQCLHRSFYFENWPNALCCSADWLPVLALYALCSLKILLHHTFVGVVWLTGGQKSKQSWNSDQILIHMLLNPDQRYVTHLCPARLSLAHLKQWLEHGQNPEYRNLSSNDPKCFNLGFLFSFLMCCETGQDACCSCCMSLGVFERLERES